MMEVASGAGYKGLFTKTLALTLLSLQIPSLTTLGPPCSEEAQTTQKTHMWTFFWAPL